MEAKVYFVALSYSSEIFKPVIVEQFDNEVDANSYAALMSRAKGKTYVVLEQRIVWEGAQQERQL